MNCIFYLIVLFAIIFLNFYQSQIAMNTTITISADTTKMDEFALVSTADATLNDVLPNTLSDIEAPAGGWNILWIPKCTITSNAKPNIITHDALDKYDFNKNKYFFEMISKPVYVRLYFDVDSVKTIDEYVDLNHWIDTLTDVFGPYTVGGYGKDEKLAEFVELPYKKGGNHPLSLHIIFPKTCLLASDLMKITKSTTQKGFTNYKLHPKIDPNVYKLGSRQLLRHVLSDKYVNDNDITETAGAILDDNLPSEQVVQVKGDERIVRQAEWETCFEKVILPTAQKKIAAEQRKASKTLTIDDISVDEDLIIFTHEELVEFLTKNFTPSNPNIFHTICPLFDSPYDIELLTEVVLEWYDTKTHHTVDTNIEEFIESKYHRDMTNKWFFSLIKNLDPDVRKEYIAKYKPSIDWDLNINTSTETFTEFDAEYAANPLRRYEACDLHKLINKLRGFIGIIGDEWYIKSRTKKGAIYFVKRHASAVYHYFDTIRPIQGNDKLTLGQIAHKYSYYFKYQHYDLSAENCPGTINKFQGYAYKQIVTDDFTIIRPFLNHIKEVICNSNEEMYLYFLQWWANIIQNITVKNGSIPIIHGGHGSGKSFVCKALCALLGNSGLRNADKMDKVFGRFNGLIENHICIVINEAEDAPERQTLGSDIKSKVADAITLQERKNIDSIEIESWANYIVTTNNKNPIPCEIGDRRNIFFATNDKYKYNKKYLNDLLKPIQPMKEGPYNEVFMGTLLHYMLTQVDVSEFDAEELIYKINRNVTLSYNPHLSRQYRSLNLVQKHIVDHSEQYRAGITMADIGPIGSYTKNSVIDILNDTCTSERRTVTVNFEKKRRLVYKLKPKEDLEDLYNIIEYMEFRRSIGDDDE